MNLPQLNTLTRDPKINDYLIARREMEMAKKKNKSRALPLWMGGLAGTGAGLIWAGNKFMTPEDRQKFDNLLALSTRMDPDKTSLTSAEPSKDFQGSAQLFYDYVDRASQAAGGKVYGMTAPDFIEAVRKSPIMRDTKFDMAKASPWDNMMSEDHYQDFAAGPLAAYMHQLQKHDEAIGSDWGGSRGAGRIYLGENVDTPRAKAIADAIKLMDKVPYAKDIRMNLLTKAKESISEKGPLEAPRYPEIGPESTPESLGSLADYFVRRSSGKADTYHEFMDKMNNRMGDFLVQEKVITPEEKGLDMREISKRLPHGQEMDLLRKFRGWVGNNDKELDKLLGRVEPLMASGMAGPARLYSTAGTVATKAFQDLPRALGAAALLASAGLGGAWLWRKMREKKKKQELNAKKRIAEERIAQMPKAASAYPGMPRRRLTPHDMMEIARGQDQWMPKILDTPGDSPAVNLASPSKQSLLWGVGLGAPVALSAAANSGSALAGLGAGTAVGGVAALIAYLARQKSNADILNAMQGLHSDSTMSDLANDPYLRARMLLMQEAAARSAY